MSRLFPKRHDHALEMVAGLAPKAPAPLDEREDDRGAGSGIGMPNEKPDLLPYHDATRGDRSTELFKSGTSAIST